MTAARCAIALLLCLMLAACGEEGPATEPGDPFADVDPTAVLPPEERDKAAPRWAVLARIAGTGDASRELEIPGRSIQWRLRWRCRDGTELTMLLEPPASQSGDLVAASCPGSGEASAVGGGRRTLSIRADGEWSAVVEHQVDTPLREPPLPAMKSGAARVLARGSFSPVERRGTGSVRLYRLPAGDLALRFEDFETTASSDLEIWLLPSGRPRTSRAAVRARHVSIGELKSTAGAQNYVLPRRVRASEVRSVVLWCDPLYMAYAAAELRPG